MMSRGWKLSEQASAVPELVLDHVFVADHVPQIAIYRDMSKQTLLGLVLDEDKDRIRRVYVPVNSTDIRALALMAASLRDLIVRRREYLIIDTYSDSRKTVAWYSNNELPPGVLPSAKSKLPESLAKELMHRYEPTWSEQGDPVIYFGQEASLRAPQKTQKTDAPSATWTGRLLMRVGELFETYLGAPLGAEASVAGSFGVRLTADDDAKLLLALGEYRRVIDSISKDRGTGATLRRVHPQVRSRFEAYFEEVAGSETDVLLTTRGGPSFLTPHVVRRHLQREQAPVKVVVKGAVETIDVDCEGRLVGLDPEGTFHFFDLDKPGKPGHMYSGKPSPQLVAHMKKEKLSFPNGYREEFLFRAVVRTPKVRKRQIVIAGKPSPLGSDVLLKLEPAFPPKEQSGIPFVRK